MFRRTGHMNNKEKLTYLFILNQHCKQSKRKKEEDAAQIKR